MKARAQQEPEHERRGGRHMHNRCINTRRTISQSAIARARFARFFDKARHFIEHRALARSRHSNRQGTIEIHRAGIDSCTAGDTGAQRLACDKARIHLRCARQNNAIGWHTITRPHQNMVARFQHRHRHSNHCTICTQELRNLAFQRRQIARCSTRALAHCLVEIAACQQEHQEHDGGVEISFRPMQCRFHHGHGQCQQNAK